MSTRTNMRMDTTMPMTTASTMAMPRMRSRPLKSWRIMAQTLPNWKPAPRRPYTLMRMEPTHENSVAKNEAAMMSRENIIVDRPTNMNRPPCPRPDQAVPMPVMAPHTASRIHGASMHTKPMTIAKKPRLYSLPSSLPKMRLGRGPCTFQAMSRAHPYR